MSLSPTMQGRLVVLCSERRQSFLGHSFLNVASVLVSKRKMSHFPKRQGGPVLVDGFSLFDTIKQASQGLKHEKDIYKSLAGRMEEFLSRIALQEDLQTTSKAASLEI